TYCGVVNQIVTKKYISITKTTKATATRDLQELSKQNILLKQGDGRSTRYVLNVCKGIYNNSAIIRSIV
ncbi:MAG TPA: hypothetical protein PLP27_05125, partial [Crocinitomicaceae bacterium]|nr:hypothetical protein [Crocinitomicaceae bacterium]